MRHKNLFLLTVLLTICLASSAFCQQPLPSTANQKEENPQVKRINEYLEQWSDYLKSSERETGPLAAQMISKPGNNTSSVNYSSLINQAQKILKHYRSREQSLSVSACEECQKIHNLTLDLYDTLISYFNALSDGESNLNAQGLLRKSQNIRNEIEQIIYALKVELRRDNPNSKYYR